MSELLWSGNVFVPFGERKGSVYIEDGKMFKLVEIRWNHDPEGGKMIGPIQIDQDELDRMKEVYSGEFSIVYNDIDVKF